MKLQRWMALVLLGALCVSFSACQKRPTNAASSGVPGAITQEEVFADAEQLSYNPLTGEPLAEGVKAGQRPVGVMMNNAQPSLPQRGVSAADAVVEMITEGGITRLLALYSNPQAMPQVGSVRSARDQHIQFALPLNAILVHIGTSVYAENLISQYSYQTIDGRYLGTQAFHFDAERAKTRSTEHCWYTDASMIAHGSTVYTLPSEGKSYPLLPFADAKNAASTPADGAAPNVRFQYAGSSVVQFPYDEATGMYKKMAYGAPHVDEANNQQLEFKNVIVLFAQTAMKPDQYCTDYNLTSGTGYYIYGGKFQKILWEKGAPEKPLQLKTTNGKSIAVNPGKVYLGIVPASQETAFVTDAEEVPLTPDASASTSAPAA